MKRTLLALLLLPGPALAQAYTPQFTSGSMNSTTTSTTSITETIVTNVYGGEVKTYSGQNVSASGGITAAGTTYSIVDTALPWNLETVTRAAGIVETTTINRTIDVDSVTTSLSVFSQ